MMVMMMTATTMIAMAIWQYILILADQLWFLQRGRQLRWPEEKRVGRLPQKLGKADESRHVQVIMNLDMSCWSKSWWWIYQLCLQQMNSTTAVSLFNVVFLQIVLCPRKIVKRLANLFLNRRWLLESEIVCNPRMEDTERLRSRMRERRRREVFEKAEKEEEREKAIFARLLSKTMPLKCWRDFLKRWRGFF